MELNEALQQVKFDKRLLDWHLKQGLITSEEVEKHLNALKDLSDQAVPVELEGEQSRGNGGFN